MKTRRGKRSEAFWPSIVMKKWLNIKPKLNDFSEDEVDTETESEDDALSLKDSRLLQTDEDHNQTAKQNQSDSHKKFSVSEELDSRGYQLRHRRGKSETLRLQYIKTKEGDNRNLECCRQNPR